MANSKKPHLRQCVGCREMHEKNEMIRILRTTEGEILIDRTGKKNGRGAYLCKDPVCLALALKNRGLEKSFRQKIPPETVETLKREIEFAAQHDGEE